MKKHILLLIFTIAAVLSHAQTWAPIGAKWTYEVSFVPGGSIDFVEWVSVADTLIGGHTCKVIQRNGYPVMSDISDKLITYEDSNIVYWYTTNKFTVLYDFNKNAGETWTISTDTCDITVTVDSTSTVIMNGYPLKVQYVSSPYNTFNGKIIQYIGHLQKPNPDFVYYCYGIVCGVNYYSGLRCHEDTSMGFYSFNIAPYCKYIKTNVNALTYNLGFSVYPNPANNQLNIKTDQAQNFKYSIYNTLGQEVKQGNITDANAIVPITELANGIYTLELSATNKLGRKTFIVQK